MRTVAATSTLVICTAFVLTLCGSGESLAGERPAWRDDPLGSRFALGAGVFAPRLDTQVRRDSSTGIPGTVIDFESTLGMDSSDQLPLVLGYYRLAKRHRLGFQYFRLDRNGESVDDEVIRFGDVLVPPNFPITSFFNVDVYALNYSYSIIHDARKELAINLGVQVQDIEMGIAGNIGPGFLVEEADVVAPLPTFGGSFDYAFNEQWIFTSLLGVFAVDIDLGADSELSGEIVQFNTGLIWKAFDNVGFALQYNYFNVDVDVDDSDWVGFLKYEYRGPVLAVAFYF
jgi:hypothetical protein